MWEPSGWVPTKHDLAIFQEVCRDHAYPGHLLRTVEGEDADSFRARANRA